MYHSARNLFNARVNFKEVIKTVVGPRQLVRAIAYAITTESGEEKPFLDALEKIGIESKVKDLQIFPGGVKKADWDVGIAIDAVRFANSVDAVILMTGDGDFIPLIEYLHGMHGIQVEVAAFARSSSQRLKEECDDFTDLGEKKFLMKVNG